MGALATLRGVSRRYGEGPAAIEGVDLDVAPGRVLCLVGPSGCGKSTLLRLLARLDAPSAGTVAFDPALDPRRDVGFVFQEPTLMPWASARDNAALPLRLRGVPRGAAAVRADEALALVGLAQAGDLTPRQLSGGMRMRVSIARALATAPRLLLMDEPFAALDEIARERLDDDLLALRAATGCAVVFVTHSVAEACYLADEVVVMAAGPGRVVARVAVEGAERGAAFRAAPAYLAAREAAGRALRAGLRAGDDL